MSGVLGSYLHREFEKRRSRNSKYSIRAFAKKLGISAATLSRLLNGKQHPSEELISKIGKNLGLSAKEVAGFQKLSQQSEQIKSNQPFLIDTEVFLKVTDLYHFALLNLIKLKRFQYDFGWIAKALGVSQFEAKEMWERLRDVGLIKRDADGRWVRTYAKTTNIKEEKVAAKGYRDLQVQILTEAIQSLHTEPSIRRDQTAITIAIDSRMLPEAKKKIAQFRKEMMAFMETDNPDQVYSMSISLFPLTESDI